MTQESPPETSEVKEWAKRIPGDIRRALKGLSGEREMAIFVLLIAKNGLAFSEIQEELDDHQQSLSNSLSSMQDAGIVVRQDRDSQSDGYSTRYTVTEFGTTLMDKLYDATIPDESDTPDPIIIGYTDSGAAIDHYEDIKTTQKDVTSRQNLDEGKEVLNYGGQREPSAEPINP